MARWASPQFTHTHLLALVRYSYWGSMPPHGGECVRAFITSDGEVHFVKVGVFRALLAEIEDADRRRHGHLKEPAASAFQGHIPFAPPHHT